MTFDNNQPIYRQIMLDFKKKLSNGSLKTGERVPSVRDLALEYNVNPNTMQKALSELEREGFLYSERTAGRQVTADEQLINQLRTDEQAAAAQRYVSEMTSLGVPQGQLLTQLADYLNYLTHLQEGNEC